MLSDCPENSFACTDGSDCIPAFPYVCNGLSDCRDGSDEDPYLCGM